SSSLLTPCPGLPPLHTLSGTLHLSHARSPETHGILNRLSSTLADVKHSLRAMDDDCYGECIRCDGPIAVKRLQSIPWAAHCVRCQEQLETGEEYAASDFYQPKAA